MVEVWNLISVGNYRRSLQSDDTEHVYRTWNSWSGGSVFGKEEIGKIALNFGLGQAVWINSAGLTFKRVPHGYWKPLGESIFSMWWWSLKFTEKCFQLHGLWSLNAYLADICFLLVERFNTLSVQQAVWTNVRNKLSRNTSICILVI